MTTTQEKLFIVGSKYANFISFNILIFIKNNTIFIFIIIYCFVLVKNYDPDLKIPSCPVEKL